MMAEGRAERRRAARLREHAVLRFSLLGRSYKGITSDVGEGGAFVRATVLPLLGTLLVLEVEETGAGAFPVRILGKVVRVERGDRGGKGRMGFAVCWKRCFSDDGMLDLLRFLNTVLRLRGISEGADRFPRELWRQEVCYDFEAGRFLSRRDLFENLKVWQHGAKAKDEDSEAPISQPGAEASRQEEVAAHSRPLPVRAPVTYSVGNRFFRGCVTQIGHDGFTIETDQHIPSLGSRVVVRLAIRPDESAPETHVRLIGAVDVHIDVAPPLERPTGFGARLLVVDETDQPGVFRRYLKQLGGAPKAS